MFSTLFPHGCGGFDDLKCPTKLGFQVHVCHDPSPGPWHIVQQPPDSPKTPDALPNFHPCSVPISVSPDATPANSDASPANSDGPLANFNAFPAATDTYPGSPKP
ncbi:hypothetical protein H2248_006491 [Termitomyces sp. 'cryptogamus']|nr:hypothetical protein H2248_006491 [Termitomyces sp. 'cryptogamus']